MTHDSVFVRGPQIFDHHIFVHADDLIDSIWSIVVYQLHVNVLLCNVMFVPDLFLCHHTSFCY